MKLRISKRWLKNDSEIKHLLGSDVEVFVTHTCLEGPNSFRCDSDLIMAEHSFDLTSVQKKALASILNKSVTKLKSAEQIDVVVSLKKIADDGLYFFEAGKDN